MRLPCFLAAGLLPPTVSISADAAQTSCRDEKVGPPNVRMLGAQHLASGLAVSPFQSDQYSLSLSNTIRNTCTL